MLCTEPYKPVHSKKKMIIAYDVGGVVLISMNHMVSFRIAAVYPMRIE